MVKGRVLMQTLVPWHEAPPKVFNTYANSDVYLFVEESENRRRFIGEPQPFSIDVKFKNSDLERASGFCVLYDDREINNYWFAFGDMVLLACDDPGYSYLDTSDLCVLVDAEEKLQWSKEGF
jgi:hypothetical protein